MKNQNVIFSSYYLAPIEYYYYLTKYKNVTVDIFETFVKQTYRNRTYIMSPNGIQSLTIPLLHSKRRNALKDVQIAYSENWQKIHWKSLEAAYRRSAYFEFYEDTFYHFYHTTYKFLLDFNQALEEKILSLIHLNIATKESTEYQKLFINIDDFRTTLNKKNVEVSSFDFPKYFQVFGDRNEFVSNLSIIDLLFNEGPNSLNYLKTIQAHR